METKQTKEEKATIDIVKEMQKTVNSLGSTIGELKTKVDAMPTDYVKSNEIGKVMTEYFKEARIYSSTVTAKIPESLTETINGLKKSFGEAKKGIDESIAVIKPRKPLLSVTISNRFLLITLLTVLLSGAVGGLIFINSPMYLAHQIYLQSTFRDISDNSYYYDDAYTKVCNGERQEIKRIIKKSKSETKSFKAVEAVLVPLINEDIFVRKIQYGHNADTLVHYRHRGDNILWSAYFASDGSVNVTSSQGIEFPMDAEKSLNSMRVKWKELR